MHTKVSTNIFIFVLLYVVYITIIN